MASGACRDAGKPLEVNYSPKGEVKEEDGLKVYLSKVESSGKPKYGVVAVMDIFGWKYKQTHQVMDRLAGEGIAGAYPDLLGDDAWPMDKFPPKPEDNMSAWMGDPARSVDTFKKKAEKAVKLLRGQHPSLEKIVLMGFCFGATRCFSINTKTDDYCAVVMCHPAPISDLDELVKKLKSPLLVVAAHGDPLEEIADKLKEKRPELYEKSKFERFDDQVHGFLAARGDYKDENVSKRAGEATQLIARYVKSL